MYIIFYSVIVESFLIMNSLLSENVTVEKDLTINDSISFKSNISLPTVCDNYSLSELLRVKEYILSSILKICGLIRYQILRGNVTMYILKTNGSHF